MVVRAHVWVRGLGTCLLAPEVSIGIARGFVAISLCVSLDFTAPSGRKGVIIPVSRSDICLSISFLSICPIHSAVSPPIKPYSRRRSPVPPFPWHPLPTPAAQVPATYLQACSPQDEEASTFTPEGASFIATRGHKAGEADEISFERGVVVQVLERNMEGWWRVRWAHRLPPPPLLPSTFLRLL